MEKHYNKDYNEIAAERAEKLFKEEMYNMDKKRRGEFYLNFCELCVQMTNHLQDICQKCKTKSLTNEKGKIIIRKALFKKEQKKWLQKYEHK